jgi:protein-L-isoaspartate(D-aspartate) O-methyltransferase
MPGGGTPAHRTGPHGDGPRVLLLWPGGLFGAGGNFGVPQLLSMAGVLRRDVRANVDVVDLDLERALGPVDLRQLCGRGYDLVGLSCYSSYDYLKVMAIGAAVRALLPEACLVVGGYHPSAVPEDFLGPESPFDYLVLGDGERPLLGLAQALGRGERPSERQLGPEPCSEPDELPPYDWTLLARYRHVARQAASQAEIYLSRGCPHRCSFCMERAKRETAWRAFSPERAVEEIHRLDRFLDLGRWTLFVADSCFGLRTSWRRSFLELLARRPPRARKLWVLTRADGLEREDLVLMARANVAPGFGLESGDPAMLARMGKSADGEAYLERVLELADLARELDLPFGANVIVGHPGETEASLRCSARLLRRLFLGDDRGTTGFLSVDPFRLYPGSRIALERERWERETGMRTYRYPWWQDGDQDFLAEWLDPSAELDYRRTLELKRELFDPILAGIARAFAYQGPAGDYFRRAIDEQLALCKPRRYLHTLGLWHLWRSLLTPAACSDEVEPSRDVGADADLARVARAAREDLLARQSFALSDALGAAMVRVPRERFVRLEDIARSAEDEALGLSDDGLATISALHAYAAAFAALGLEPGAELVELGSGTGYGAALASEIVGPTGRVRTLEIDAALAERARRNLAGYPQAEALHADAHATERWRGATRVYVAFALRELPAAWLDALAPGGRLVAPVGEPDAQELTLFEQLGSRVVTRGLGAVSYVADRGKRRSAAHDPDRPQD